MAVLSQQRLGEIATELASRPGHEKVRSLFYELLVHGLGVDSRDIAFEVQLPEVRGRADAILGSTVFEFKRDMRRERAEAEDELHRNLTGREVQTQHRYVGIATDGADLVAYELRRGQLRELGRHRVDRRQPQALLGWLEAAVAARPDLDPTPERVRQEFGRDSLAYARAKTDLQEAWAAVGERPDVRLRRELWADLLAHVYGSSVDEDDLFFQHTFLTIVAKAMATLAFTNAGQQPADLLSGRAFREAGITGAIESDFFDWVLEAPRGARLVERITNSVARFRLSDIASDVLKALYESLIDPQQRHDLGEYYTPDWLAAWICDRAVADPLNQRVLDPACGSGTFLFHAVRRYLAAADAAGVSNAEALATLAQRVRGIDIHPVAVIIARVTYLLAIGQERLRDRSSLTVPVYLGDALQWNTQSFLAEREVLIGIPGGSESLLFPFSVTRDPLRFDRVVEAMLAMSSRGGDAASFDAWLLREGVEDPGDRSRLMETYGTLRELEAAGRNHIWGYVARNQSRPIWLSTEGERADVVVGNPPWLAYRFMAPQMQRRFRAECHRRGLWAGGEVATHQDLSAYFFVRAVELYLKPGGTIGFVMPYASLSRRQYAGFRRGQYPPAARRRSRETGQVVATLRFEEAWAFDEDVQPLFPVPSCVLFARAGEAGPLPDAVTAYRGTLPRRDAGPEEAQLALAAESRPWPSPPAAAGSPYRDRFRNGATIFPRVFSVVEEVPPGPLGADPEAPVVRSRRTAQEKRPWKYVDGLQGQVERAFLRPLYLGESIAPFRVLAPALAVIPWDEGRRSLLDSAGASRAGYPHVAAWLSEAELKWKAYQRSRLSLAERWNYHGELSAQFPVPSVRLVYTASGTQPAATLLRDRQGVVENTAYWMGTDERQGRYLEAILNSDTVRSRAVRWQPRGQWGPRHFHKFILSLEIPAFDLANPTHLRLVSLAKHAEEVAALVDVPPGLYFVRARQRIRDALRRDGVAGEIDRAVATLLGVEAPAMLRAAEQPEMYGDGPEAVDTEG